MTNNMDTTNTNTDTNMYTTNTNTNMYTTNTRVCHCRRVQLKEKEQFVRSEEKGGMSRPRLKKEVGWLDRLVDRLVYRLMYRLVDRLVDRLMYRLVDRLVDRVVGQVSVQGKPLCFEISSRLQICPISFSDVIVHSETQSLWLLAEMFTIPFLFDLDL